MEPRQSCRIDLITIVWRGHYLRLRSRQVLPASMLPDPSLCDTLFSSNFVPEVRLLSRKNGIALMLGVAAGLALLMFRLPAIPQPASYHQFADQRHWLGIPNFGNVISNLAFAAVAFCGIMFMRRRARQIFLDPRERWPYYGVFVGLLLTALGSGY